MDRASIRKTDYSAKGYQKVTDKPSPPAEHADLNRQQLSCQRRKRNTFMIGLNSKLEKHLNTLMPFEF